MNKLPTHARRWIINLISVFALAASVGAMASTDDTYSIDEDSELSVAAPGVLANDIPPDEPSSVVTAVLLLPSPNVGPTGSTNPVRSSRQFSSRPQLMLVAQDRRHSLAISVVQAVHSR